MVASKATAWDAYLRSVTLLRDQVASFDQYPYSIPSIRGLKALNFHPQVTFFVGENGSGKSTLMEALAVATGFNAEGGSQNMRFATRPSESDLHTALRLVRGLRRPKTGYFLRAESFYNVATQVEQNDVAAASHGGRSLHEQSHGESFLALVQNRFYANGLYLLDEPEAALSPQRQLAFLVTLDDLVRRQGCQFIIATHSPIILAYPHATIYALGAEGPQEVKYEETEHFALTRDFLVNRERYLKRLLGEE